MRTRRGLGPAIALGLGVVACVADGPVAPSDGNPGVVPPVAADRLQGPRPFHGHLDGVALPGATCSEDPPGVLITATGSGVVTHLGATALLQTVCVDFDFVPIGRSDVSLTAADGDRVDGVLVAVTFRADGFDMEIEITGGTGRFAGAGGAYDVDVSQAAPLQPFSAAMSGWIEY